MTAGVLSGTRAPRTRAREAARLRLVTLVTAALCLAPPFHAHAQTRAEAIVWGPAGRYGQFAPLTGSWGALAAIDTALTAPANGATVYVSGGGAALRLAIAAAGSTGTLIEITDSATYDWVTFHDKSRVYVRARTGQSPKIVSDPSEPTAASGGNSNALVFTGANTDIGLQGLTFLVGRHGNAESPQQPSKIGAIRYSTLAGGTRLQGLLIQDCRFEPLDRSAGAVIALQLSNETGSTLLHRDIGVRRTVFDSTGTVEAAARDLAAISVADFQNVLVANVHFRRTSTQPSPSEMRGARLNVRDGLVEYAYCEDIGSMGAANDCVFVSDRTGNGLGSLDSLNLTVRNSAALSVNRGFAVAKANSSLTLDHVVVVTGSADQVLRIGDPTAALAVSNSIFLQLSGSSALLHNSANGPFSTHHNLYRWLGPWPFTPDASDLYPGALTCSVNCDPQFINPLGSDFRMASGSPALKAAGDGADMGPLYYSIDPAARSFGTTGGPGAVSVIASGPWSGAPTVPWITPASVGPVNGNATVNYLVGANTGSTPRTGTMLIAGIPHTVMQSGISCTPTLTPGSRTLTAAGGSGSVQLSQAAADCTWSAASDVPWMTVTSGATGTGTGGPIGYAVAANTSSMTRVGTVTVTTSGGSVTFVATQAGVGCNYALGATGTSLPSAAVFGLTVDVTAAVSDCSWSAYSNAPTWLHVTGGTPGMGPGTVTFRADANPNSTTRTGTLTIAGQAYTVTQQGIACTQQLSSFAAYIGSGGGAGTPLSVTSSAPDCTWSSIVDPAARWLSLQSPTVQVGSSVVNWAAQPNTSSQARTGIVTVAGTPFSVTQAGVTCAFALSSAASPTPQPAAGGSSSVGVDAAAPDCPWTSQSNVDWVTITTGADTSGDGTVTFTVAPNPSSFSRHGTLTVAGQSYTVTQNGLACGYFLNPAEGVVPPGGGSGAVDLFAQVADCTWSAAPAVGVDWVSVTSPSPATGSGTVTYSAVANPRSTERVGTLVIAGRTFTLRQPGVECDYALSATSAAVGASASSGAVTVTTNATDCAWRVTAGDAWVTLSNTSQRTGTAAVSYSVAANSSSLPRETVLTIAGRAFTVRQDGVACTYALTPTTASATAIGGALTVKVTTPAADCAWTNTASDGWLTITSGTQRQGTQNITLNVASNTSSSKPRTGTVTVNGAGGATSVYTVSQAATACTFTVPTTATAVAGGGTIGIDIGASPADCEWTAASEAAWLTIAPSEQVNSGSRRLQVTVAPTTSSKSRAGSVAIGSKKVSVTQAGLVCAYSLSETSASFDYRAANGVVDLVANASDCQWTTAKSATWITLGTASGAGSKLLTYAVAANATTVPRQTSVTFAGIAHTVTQGPAPCAISLGSTAGSVTAGSTTGSFAVTAVSPECTWYVSKTDPWLTITAPAPVTPGSTAPLSAQGSGSVKFTVTPNPSSKPRTAVIQVSDRTYTLTQAGAACTYTLDPTTATLPPQGGGAQVKVTASVSDCAWGASTLADWISLDAIAGTGNGTVPFSVRSHSGTKIRTGTISVSGKNVTVTQTPQGSGGALFTRYLAEGATSDFFSTRLALVNPGTAQGTATLRFLAADGRTVEHPLTVKPSSRVTLDARALIGTAEFSLDVESTVPLVVDRTMTWDRSGYGSHAETAVQFPAHTWYLAEGSTAGDFDLFYLVQNPNDAPANLQVKFLLPGGGSPIVRAYTVAPNSRFTLWVDQIPELARVDLSGVVTADRPVIVERAMYLTRNGRWFAGGHESAGVTDPSTEWYLAEGATGAYFDTYLLLANPTLHTADVLLSYLLPGGTVVEKSYLVEPQSRFSIWVDQEDPLLADTAVSAIVRSVNNVPIIAERAMWWPGNWTTWTEAHNSPGVTEPGTKWALAEGEVGGPQNAQTYVLIANTASRPAQVKVTLLFEAATPVSKTLTLPANSRTNVDVRFEFPTSVDTRFGVLVESLGTTPAPIVVERAMYTDAGGVTWAAGTNAVATKLQ